jgi:hypothetical protein
MKGSALPRSPNCIAWCGRVGTWSRLYKSGDGEVRRSGNASGLGVTYDVYWLSSDEVSWRAADAGFEPVFWATRSADADELQPQGYLIARRTE